MTIMTAKATGFGPFAETQVLEFDLSRPESVVKGYNGVGKSTLVSLIRRSLGDTSAAPTRTIGRDQPAEFLLEMSGASITLRLGEKFSGSNAAALAAFPVQLATKDTAQLEQLIGPDDQTASNSPEARNRRLVALASIAGIGATPANLAFMASELDIPLTGWKSDNIADIRKEMYSRLTAQAKVYTTKADEAAGQIKAIKSQIATIPQHHRVDFQTDPLITPEQAEAAYQLAAREFVRVEQSHKSRLDQDARIRQLEAGMPAPNWTVEMLMAYEKLGQLFAYAPVNSDLSHASACISIIAAELNATISAMTKWRTQRQILDTPVTGATAEDVASAKAKEEAAALTRTHAQAFRSHTQLKAQLVASTDAEALARATARKYEAAAKQISARLGTLIQRAGLEQMSVNEDGEVVCRVDDQWFPFALRSRSQRVLAAVILVASQVKPVPGKMSLLLLSDTLYTSLDEMTREILDACLQQYAGYVHILTEAPSSADPLSVG